MRGAKKTLPERLKLAGVLFNLRSEHIGEQIATHVSQQLPVYNQSLAGTLGVAHEIGLDAEERSKVIDKTAAPTEYVKTGEQRLIGVDVDERETDRYFELREVILGSCSHSDQT